MANENHAPFPAEPAMNMGVKAITALGAMLATLCARTSNGVTLRRAKPPEWSLVVLMWLFPPL
ncbi:unannotated protein [freshwater metagenome]|uniref:Unannotated protein n=1 Tax=freshwater metagenome TaxID=449393 RepID=A0A6J7E0B1_9ZZZZ